MKRRWFLHSGISTAVIGMAGCSSSGDSTTSPDKTEGTTPNEKTTEAQTGESTASDTSASLDPAFQTKLAPKDVEPDSGLFGTSVALSNNIALVGFPRGPDNDSLASGNVYSFEKSGGGWKQQAILTAADGDSSDSFGISVAMADDASIALIGAFEDEDPNGPEAGSAYVFQRSGDSWSQQAKLTPKDGDGSDGFGVSVELSENASIALIGAYTDDDPNGKRGGSAYIFEKTGNEWAQQAKLAADDGDSQDLFGIDVSMSEGTVLVGASRDEDPNGEKGGSAYIFEKTGNGWTQQAKLTADDGEESDQFGQALALNGATALVGSENAANANEDRVGAVYIFERVDGRWSRQAKLTADDGILGAGFSGSIDISNEVAIIGTPFDIEPNGKQAGSAYLFQRTEKDWRQQAKIAANDGDSGDWFGSSVALDGNTAIVGANHDEDPNGREGGSAYVFTF